MSDMEAVEVECPSGMKGLLRPIRVGDMTALTAGPGQGKKRKNVDQLGALFRGVWDRTLDSCLYREEVGIRDGERIDRWENIYLGDRSWLVYAARRITYGDDLYFSIPCRSCGTRIDWHVDINELQVRSFGDEMRNAIEEAGPDAMVYRRLPGAQVKVGLRPLTGSDQFKVQQARQSGQGQMGEAALLCRMPYIENATSPRERRDFVRSMSLPDLEWLRDEWETLDIYVQETVEVECQECYAETEVVIPIDERFFSQRSARPRQAPKFGS